MYTSFDPLPDLARRPGFLLRKAHQVAVAIFTDEIGKLALTPPQHNLLAAVRAHPGCHQTGLARMVGYDRATVGAMLAGLEARALIQRDGSLQDKRLKTLKLTRRGVRLLQSADAAIERISERIVAPLARDERPVFLGLLAKIAFHDPLAEAAGP